MKVPTTLLIWGTIVLGCQGTTSEVEGLRSELDLTRKIIDSLQERLPEQHRLGEVFKFFDADREGIHHLVFLKLKENIAHIEKEEVKRQLLSLKKIEQVKYINVFQREDVGDVRAMNYDMLLHVVFEDTTALSIYDRHPFHGKVRLQLTPFLETPPTTFDYIIK